MSDDALAAAANELKANGVEGVTSQTSVDPMQELKFIPGIDANKLQTFDREAKDAAVGPGGRHFACVAAMLAIVLVV